MARLVLHRRVRRYAEKLPADTKKRIKAKLEELAKDPAHFTGAVKMAGEWQGYQRIRIGTLRVIYIHETEEGVVYIDYLGPRGEIYKNS